MNKENTLINDLCENVLNDFPNNNFDLIFTDPPYNLRGYSTGNIKFKWRSDINNDIAEWDGFFDPKTYKEILFRILKENGKLLVFCSYNTISIWHDLFGEKFDNFSLFFWHKTNPVPKFKKKGFLNSIETIICFWNDSSDWYVSDTGFFYNFFECPICMGNERIKSPKHPAQKPIKLLEHLILAATKEGDFILDPFMGVGSTGIAALRANRKFVGIEVDNDYFLAAKTRFERQNPLG